ncbi:hypothetical protein PsYK624_107390 [Phanerochaete sordida]|uniref:Protein kinase domain-containing protein n=1 Tax=Phanerochaete sordida TaxID=48140 RepID=A0A9P3LHD7_9APHY|nr:hypothetical protein PsYK624_107390 [Phanerochaete sordida]
MTSNAHNPLDVYRTYPEKNPYEIEPPVFNLVPCQAAEEVDTPQLKKACLNIAKRTGINVLQLTYGQYPFLLGELDDEEIETKPEPLSQYQPPPPLSRSILPDDAIFVSQLNKNGNTPIFVVKIGDDERVLKIYPEVDMYSDYRYTDSFDDEDQPVDPKILFAKEKEAYAHLLHAGVCEQRHVPRCYGWVELTPVHIDAIACVAPKLKYCESHDLSHLRKKAAEGRFPKGILLEYFPRAKRLSFKNVSYELSEQAVRSLHAIHAAYVHHGDIENRNVLVLPDDRVVWVDFNASTCTSDPKLTREQLFLEFHKGWNMFYMYELPNQRIGWDGLLGGL